MDKDKFRGLLQTFEQLSIKPELDADYEPDVSTPCTPTLASRRLPSLHTAEPTSSDIDRFLDIVKDNGTSFPELESTHPPPDNLPFQPSAILKSTTEEYVGESGMRIQQQLLTASRFRLTAGVAARIYFQLNGMAADRTITKAVRARVATLEDDLISVCSANLIEAGQLEKRALEDHAESLKREGILDATSPSAAASSAVSAMRNGKTEPFEAYSGIGGLVNEPVVEVAPKAAPKDVALGARISEYANAWLGFCTDPWVISTVTHGLLFDFSAEPEYNTMPDPEYSANESAAIEKVIRWDLGDKVIEEIPYRPELFVSHMFTLPIAGKLKSLVEFRLLNKYLEAGNIQVDETPSLCSLLKEGDWITRINIKCAYPSVPIHPDHRRFLVFKYDDRYYQYRAMPFGISVASKVFTKLLQAALQPLREEGFRVTSHIDEICLLHESFPELTERTKRLCRHLDELGFIINMSTSDLVPQQNQRFLGFVFNTLDNVVQFPKDQIKKVRRAAHTARSAKITARQLASLLGKIRSIMPAIGPEMWRIKEIEMCLDQAITTPESWDDVIPLPETVIIEIDWLLETILVQKSMALGSS